MRTHFSTALANHTVRALPIGQANHDGADWFNPWFSPNEAITHTWFFDSLYYFDP